MHRIGGDVAQLAELVADEGVLDFDGFHGGTRWRSVERAS
jgi:hypothetical protein